MEELRIYCKELRNKYPKTMNKEQFYRAAHISKATALYLLQSGLVPCQDTGKKTRYNEKRLADIFAREMRDLPDLLTIADVVDFIGCYKDTAQAWCRSGKLKAFRISGRFLIPKEYFIQYLASPRMYYSALQTTYYKYIIAQYHQQCNPTTDACLDVPTEDAE